MIDDEDMTYVMDYAQYAQVGQAHSLGEEVRDSLALIAQLTKQLNDTLDLNTRLNKEHIDLEFKVKMQASIINYWQNSYRHLWHQVSELFCLYGWGGDLEAPQRKFDRIIDDIHAMRKRIHDYKKGAIRKGGRE